MNGSRSGFTLVELLITAVVMAILGTALARMLVNDARFVGRVEAQLTARQTARAAMTVISNELSMVARQGITVATPTRLTVRMPVAWGMACQRSGGNIIASLIPTDSLILAQSGTSGVEWIDSAGTNRNGAAVFSLIAGPRSECTADSIRVVAGGQYAQLVPGFGIGPTDLPSGTIFHTYDLIEYEFKASSAYPGRIALWRDSEGNGLTEELLAPFDSTTRFEFVTSANGTPSATPPGTLSDIEAIELVLIGESVETPRGASDPEEFELRTRVTFVN